MTKKTDFDSERKIPLLFDPERIGRSLHEVAIDVIETEQSSVLSRWFHSQNDVDLFIWMDEDKNVIKHQVNFLGQVVEWNVFDGVRTGVIVEQELVEESTDGVSEVIRFDASTQGIAVYQAMRLLEFVSDLADGDRATLLKTLKENIRATNQASDEFLRRYAGAFKKEQRRSGFWKRVKRWFSGTGS